MPRKPIIVRADLWRTLSSSPLSLVDCWRSEMVQIFCQEHWSCAFVITWKTQVRRTHFPGYALACLAEGTKVKEVDLTQGWQVCKRQEKAFLASWSWGRRKRHLFDAHSRPTPQLWKEHRSKTGPRMGSMFWTSCLTHRCWLGSWDLDSQLSLSFSATFRQVTGTTRACEHPGFISLAPFISHVPHFCPSIPLFLGPGINLRIQESIWFCKDQQSPITAVHLVCQSQVARTSTRTSAAPSSSRATLALGTGQTDVLTLTLLLLSGMSSSSRSSRSPSTSSSSPRARASGMRSRKLTVGRPLHVIYCLHKNIPSPRDPKSGKLAESLTGRWNIKKKCNPKSRQGEEKNFPFSILNVKQPF